MCKNSSFSQEFSNQVVETSANVSTSDRVTVTTVTLLKAQTVSECLPCTQSTVLSTLHALSVYVCIHTRIKNKCFILQWLSDIGVAVIYLRLMKKLRLGKEVNCPKLYIKHELDDCVFLLVFVILVIDVFWLCWLFIAGHSLSLVVEVGAALVVVCTLLIALTSLVAEPGL